MSDKWIQRIREDKELLSSKRRDNQSDKKVLLSSPLFTLLQNELTKRNEHCLSRVVDQFESGSRSLWSIYLDVPWSLGPNMCQRRWVISFEESQKNVPGWIEAPFCEKCPISALWRLVIDAFHFPSSPHLSRVAKSSHFRPDQRTLLQERASLRCCGVCTRTLEAFERRVLTEEKRFCGRWFTSLD